MPRPSEKNKAIIESQAFRAINLLIDQTAEEIVGTLSLVKLRLGELGTTTPKYANIRVRTSEEGEKQIDLPLDTRELDNLVELGNRAQESIRMIGELQRYKLRLLNDYDFTRDDSTEQEHVFGKTTKGEAE